MPVRPGDCEVCGVGKPQHHPACYLGMLTDSGIRYCTAHEGIIEQDATKCDFTVDEDGECISTPLLYHRQEAT